MLALTLAGDMTDIARVTFSSIPPSFYLSKLPNESFGSNYKTLLNIYKKLQTDRA